jgi:hypothetical protein
VKNVLSFLNIQLLLAKQIPKLDSTLADFGTIWSLFTNFLVALPASLPFRRGKQFSGDSASLTF